uniref:Probable ribonuclease ZC3H12C n=1 Tax=Phallusia mammillata TaxID=59560 RepID=A0A6F9DWQ0_9ASCI|nr:probable ribonuclease ZC3H12C [Phallusia mammillata]
MDVKFSTASEARSGVPAETATLHGAHSKDLKDPVGPSDEIKAPLERNADSGYHTGSWSEIECTASINDRDLEERKIMQTERDMACMSDKACLNGTGNYTDTSFTSGCLSCAKEQANTKTSFTQGGAVMCKHSVCNFTQRDQLRRHSDIDSNGNVVPRTVNSRIYESGSVTTNSQLEHCGIPNYACISLTGNTPTLVQSTTCSNTLNYQASVNIQSTTTQPLFSNSTHGTISSNGLKNSADKLETEAQDLALKIEFCLKFGYTASQIRAAISKLSYKATKNDIIKELFNFSSVENPLLSHGPLVEQLPADPKYGNLVMRGISPSSQDIYHSRGPLTLENGTKQAPPKPEEDDSQNLRPIVIDGSNVAMSHGNKQYFSCKGILLAVDFFRMRNHRDITVFIPQYRKETPRPDAPIRDREILDELEQERILVYTPSRCINGKRVTCYDDRFILRLAEETDGIIVSNDNFRDLQNEKQQWKELIEKRLLMYSFVNDRFMPPDDPLGRNGPSIDNFLRKRPASEEQTKPQCPYGKKCTYGKKCKFFHPECSFSQKSVTEQLKEKSEKRMQVSKEAETLAAELVQKESQTPSPERMDTLDSNSGRKIDSPPHVGLSTKEGPESPSSNPNHMERYGSRMSPSSQQQVRQPMPANNMPGYPNPRSNSYPYHQGVVMGPNDGRHAVNNGQYPHSGESLSDGFRQMKIANNSSSPMHSGGHPFVHQMNQRMQHFSHQRHMPQQQQQQQQQQMPFRYVEQGPPNLHTESGRNMRANMVQQGQGFHGSSPAGLMYDGSSGMMVSPQAPHINPYYNHMPPHMYPNPQVNYPEYPPHQMVYYPPQIHHGMIQYMTSVSSGSGSSVSKSFPFVDGGAPTMEQLSTVSVNSDDPKTFPPRRPNRVCGYPASPAQQVESRPPAAVDNLDSEVNPRHNLFKNLCGLFPRVIVEKVMGEHPEMREPKRLIKLCLGEEN